MDSPISILIGENGCGKSEVLSIMALDGTYEFSSVIAIATSVYDKFPRRNCRKNYHYMGSRLGRFIPREAIKEAISTSKWGQVSSFAPFKQEERPAPNHSGISVLRKTNFNGLKSMRTRS